jgi:hypothetical protein
MFSISAIMSEIKSQEYTILWLSFIA